MSSDTFTCTITQLEPLKLRVRTGTAGGLDDYAESRSFVLLALYDLASENKVAASPLAALDPREMLGEQWHKENIARYVKSVRLLGRHNKEIAEFEPEEIDELHDWMDSLEEEDPLKLENDLCERCHSFDLEVELSDPKLVTGLATGMIAGTTAFDVWWEG